MAKRKRVLKATITDAGPRKRVRTKRRTPPDLTLTPLRHAIIVTFLTWQKLRRDAEDAFMLRVKEYPDQFSAFSGKVQDFDEDLSDSSPARMELLGRMSVPPDSPEFINLDAAPRARSRDAAFRNVHQVLMLYRLWDCLAAALDMEEGPDVNFAALKGTAVSQSMSTDVMVYSEHFPNIVNIPDIPDFIMTARDAIAQEYSWFSEPFEETEASKLEFRRGVVDDEMGSRSPMDGILSNLCKRVSSMNAQRILINVELVCLMIRWVLFQGEDISLDIGKAIQKYIVERIASNGPNVPDLDHLRTMQIDTPCAYATLFSPLLLFHRFLLTGRRAMTPLLLGAFMQCQKEKPAWIVYTENLLWRRLVDIAAGKYETVVGLHKFFSDWSRLWNKHSAQLPDPRQDWFLTLIPAFPEQGQQLGRLELLSDADEPENASVDSPTVASVIPDEDSPGEPDKDGPGGPTLQGDDGTTKRISARTNKGKKMPDLVAEDISFQRKSKLLAAKKKKLKIDPIDDDDTDPVEDDQLTDDDLPSEPESENIEDDIDDLKPLKPRFLLPGFTHEDLKRITVDENAYNRAFRMFDIPDKAPAASKSSQKLGEERVLGAEERAELVLPVPLPSFSDGTSPDPAVRDFCVHPRVAKVEYKLLQEIIQSAMSLDDDSPRLVSVFSYERWNSLSTVEQLEEYSSRNIIIHGHPIEGTFSWDTSCFKTKLGLSPDDTISVQDMSKRNLQNISAQNIRVPVQELIEAGKKGGHKGRVYNALSIPIGKRPLVDIAGLAGLDMGRVAWIPARQTMQLKARQEFPYPDHAVSWATAATTDATSWPHIDGEGAGTAVVIVQGMKLWCIARRKSFDHGLETINAVPEGFEPSAANTDFFEYEMYLLREKDCLIMQPGTLHYVLTVEPTIVYGQHFYSLPHIRKSVMSLGHALFTERMISNEAHIGMIRIVVRLLPYWFKCYKDGIIDPCTCPDISTVDGILTVIAVGNVVLFHNVLLLRPHVTSFREKLTIEELVAAKLIYVHFMRLILRSYEIRVDTSTRPTNEEFSVFHAGILRFAQALIAYAKKEEILGLREEAHSTQSRPVKKETVELTPANVFRRTFKAVESFWPNQWEALLPLFPDESAAVQGSDEEQATLEDLLQTRFELEESIIHVVRRESQLEKHEINIEPFRLRQETNAPNTTRQVAAYVEISRTVQGKGKQRQS
ncbi:hypothetical protein PUNSTDRAFT_139555 [Punctularia strigosozonata HHB-11173 SS5]|uniref:JmjC domain-containing protein n=1 Tax=Punctularia strigosozonata (strain HHB-11173) TaxID=741275 RepID=R7S0V9_PUNST|nr:uncharacterized protein PUNSTDRAFT_139555 [Punctularia strigosozonata HHB-11173 SS5]EIN03432.1 hypothetical protein PUNSTDRAFT_139555 [Punctularia strigosozonata HHB-11173 SS5]